MCQRPVGLLINHTRNLLILDEKNTHITYPKHVMLIKITIRDKVVCVYVRYRCNNIESRAKSIVWLGKCDETTTNERDQHHSGFTAKCSIARIASKNRMLSRTHREAVVFRVQFVFFNLFIFCFESVAPS